MKTLKQHILLIALPLLVGLSVMGAGAPPSLDIQSNVGYFIGKDTGTNSDYLEFAEEVYSAYQHCDQFKTNVLTRDQWVTNGAGVYKGNKWYSYTDDRATWENTDCQIYIPAPICDYPWYSGSSPLGTQVNQWEKIASTVSYSYGGKSHWFGGYHYPKLYVRGDYGGPYFRVRVSMTIYSAAASYWTGHESVLDVHPQPYLTVQTGTGWQLLGTIGTYHSDTYTWTFDISVERGKSYDLIPNKGSGTPNWYQWYDITAVFI